MQSDSPSPEFDPNTQRCEVFALQIGTKDNWKALPGYPTVAEAERMRERLARINVTMKYELRDSLSNSIIKAANDALRLPFSWKKGDKENPSPPSSRGQTLKEKRMAKTSVSDPVDPAGSPPNATEAPAPSSGVVVDADVPKPTRNRVALDTMLYYTGPETNPRRTGTFGFTSLGIIKRAGAEGITYEKFLKAGGRAVDLSWDVNHGYAKTVPVGVDPANAASDPKAEERAAKEAAKAKKAEEKAAAAAAKEAAKAVKAAAKEAEKAAREKSKAEAKAKDAAEAAAKAAAEAAAKDAPAPEPLSEEEYAARAEAVPEAEESKEDSEAED